MSSRNRLVSDDDLPVRAKRDPSRVIGRMAIRSRVFKVLNSVLTLLSLLKSMSKLNSQKQARKWRLLTLLTLLIKNCETRVSIISHTAVHYDCHVCQLCPQPRNHAENMACASPATQFRKTWPTLRTLPTWPTLQIWNRSPTSEKDYKTWCLSRTLRTLRTLQPFL